MKKLFLSLCLITLGFGSILAGPVDQQKAQIVAAKFLSTTALYQRNTDIQVQLVSTISPVAILALIGGIIFVVRKRKYEYKVES